MFRCILYSHPRDWRVSASLAEHVPLKPLQYHSSVLPNMFPWNSLNITALCYRTCSPETPWISRQYVTEHVPWNPLNITAVCYRACSTENPRISRQYVTEHAFLKILEHHGSMLPNMLYWKPSNITVVCYRTCSPENPRTSR